MRQSRATDHERDVQEHKNLVGERRLAAALDERIKEGK
jgi:hypothetical protein